MWGIHRGGNSVCQLFDLCPRSLTFEPSAHQRARCAQATSKGRTPHLLRTCDISHVDGPRGITVSRGGDTDQPRLRASRRPSFDNCFFSLCSDRPIRPINWPENLQGEAMRQGFLSTPYSSPAMCSGPGKLSETLVMYSMRRRSTDKNGSVGQRAEPLSFLSRDTKSQTFRSSSLIDHNTGLR
jgi:hypothetical protein